MVIYITLIYYSFGDEMTDDQGQPLFVGHTDALVDRNVDELIGLCRGISADGCINQQEAEYLLEWMKKHSKYLKIYPFNIIFKRLDEMLSDNLLDQEEQRELLDIVQQITGDSTGLLLQNSDASSMLPLSDPIPEIIIQNHSFVFTGVFTVGTRKKCEEITVELGGEIHKNIKKTTNYLVIGYIGSEFWTHSTHGRKIEKAIIYRDEKNTGLEIISEHHWIQNI